MSTILLSGATGFIGSRVAASFMADGHRVVRLSRRRGVADSVWWDAEAGDIDADAFARARADVIVNLAGENIAQRWTSRTRARIRDSRIRGTSALADAVVRAPHKPQV